MRWAPLIGRPDGWRRISVAARCSTLASALHWAALWGAEERRRKGGLWIARLGQAAHRRQRGRREPLTATSEAIPQERRHRAAGAAGAAGAASLDALVERLSDLLDARREEFKNARPAQEARALRFSKCR
jgi:hypothetical protein